jgi:hypothetical protein
MSKTGRIANHAHLATGCPVMILSPVLLLLLAVTGFFAWLRETPMFWLNAGGYPVWLRDMVYDWFFPCYGLSLLLLCAWQFFVLQSVLRARWTVIPGFVSSLFFWGIFCLITCIVAANNIVNLANGRGLHDH